MHNQRQTFELVHFFKAFDSSWTFARSMPMEQKRSLSSAEGATLLQLTAALRALLKLERHATFSALGSLRSCGDAKKDPVQDYLNVGFRLPNLACSWPQRTTASRPS
jgi:hypothetical protein